MKIGEFSRRAGETVDTLRYYDRIGLLVPGRGECGSRIYSEEDLDKMKEIQILKSLDFTLEEIKTILDLDSELDECLERGMSKSEVFQAKEEAVGELRKLIGEKLEELARKEEEIRKARDRLKEIKSKLRSPEKSRGE